VTDADPSTAAAPNEPPWTLPFAECPFALVDCEMTGLDPARDALVEVAVARVVGGAVVERFSTLLHSEVPSVPGALGLHGLDAAALAGAPAFGEVAPRLDALLDGAVPVMHGAELDVRFLDLAFAGAGLARRVGPTLDTVRLARRAVHARHYNLGALCAALGVGPVRWHRAVEDVRALVPLFNRLCAALAPVDALDLWQVRAADGRVQVRAAIARALAARAGDPRPLRFVIRTPGHAEREITARVLWFRPPHVGLARVGAAVVPAILRADRVLRLVG
jgi:DNA polymerase-3 subunit epsilon